SEGGLRAHAVGAEITVDGRDRDELKQRIEDAVYSTFAEGEEPKRIRLHWRTTPSEDPRP
ncbi:MAG: hypothetical protein ACR2PL_28005, partial [Dehalococcoidia bacterium]